MFIENIESLIAYPKKIIQRNEKLTVSESAPSAVILILAPITTAKLEIAQRISPPSGGLVLILIRTAQGSRMPPERSTGGAMPSSFVAHRTTCSLTLPMRT